MDSITVSGTKVQTDHWVIHLLNNQLSYKVIEHPYNLSVCLFYFILFIYYIKILNLFSQNVIKIILSNNINNVINTFLCQLWPLSFDPLESIKKIMNCMLTPYQLLQCQQNLTGLMLFCFLWYFSNNKKLFFQFFSMLDILC